GDRPAAEAGGELATPSHAGGGVGRPLTADVPAGATGRHGEAVRTSRDRRTELEADRGGVGRLAADPGQPQESARNRRVAGSVAEVAGGDVMAAVTRSGHVAQPVRQRQRLRADALSFAFTALAVEAADLFRSSWDVRDAVLPPPRVFRERHTTRLAGPLPR